MSETFHPIPGYGGKFRVSDLGTVRRDDGFILTPSKPRHRGEYPCVHLRFDGIRKRVAVHRLVALAWIGPPPFDGAEVRHLDGDHMNPRVGNLAWGSRKENSEDRERHGRTPRGPRPNRVGKATGPANGNYRVTPEMKAKACSLVEQGYSQRMAAEAVGITQKSVWAALRAKAAQ